ncbi:hypothetical protein kochi14H1_0980 [Enterococcus phage phi EF14H1]|uniref:Uncharacterized protein n=3 Tax=Kochikohdavirus TaxID=2560160 RepID=A0ACA9ATS7_9CAUD|nr:Phage protein [Enterococcus phage 156]CAD0300608.1 hypothetical protein [Enterococcus phage vB_EfaH_149]BBE37167.1 hypothetical protein PHIEF17H_0980 [Enterococcus phage phiEF17H]BBE37370.1 hypothetical protein PHIM1EF22_0970 [Enterococcus phage phiM1EF22]BCN33169.1 hypothetical protein kochiEF7H_0980 [Enterococcus phage phi EF7H]BCN33373.1 hypothetical protein kochi14H1_0980 [Enterococcus phage phi EF14H1]BCN33577.1 hypothetical protein kochiEF19G_0980 [Enterococcus phage phi EF19G]
MDIMDIEFLEEHKQLVKEHVEQELKLMHPLKKLQVMTDWLGDTEDKLSQGDLDYFNDLTETELIEAMDASEIVESYSDVLLDFIDYYNIDLTGLEEQLGV